MKATIRAIKVLIEARNKKYGGVIPLRIEEKVSWSDRPMLVISGFEAPSYFAQMKPFLEPMICNVVIQNDREVHLEFS